MLQRGATARLHKARVCDQTSSACAPGTAVAHRMLLAATHPCRPALLAQAHYVERLSVLYIHNAAVVVKQLYKLVSPFIRE